jgi:polyhydroxybutyrate depolymerase
MATLASRPVHLLVGAASCAAWLGACGGSDPVGQGGTSSGSITTASGGASTTSSSSTSSSSTTTGAGGRPSDPPVDVTLGGRAYDLKLPPGHDPKVPAPLLIEMHGFADASAAAPWDDEEARNQLVPEAGARGVMVALAHGTVDAKLGRFIWNATDGCCDVDHLAVNDVGYVAAIVENVKKTHAVDPKRVFLFGHNAGGMMANRLACDLADVFAGAVSVAGPGYLEPSMCAASAPLAYLQIHGDADMTILYNGGGIDGITGLSPIPSALATVQHWAQKNRCAPKADTSTPPFSITADLGGNETTALLYDGCEANGRTELWTMHLGPDAPTWNASFAPKVLDFLMNHPKP